MQPVEYLRQLPMKCNGLCNYTFHYYQIAYFLIFCFNTGVHSVIQTNLELTIYLKQGLNLWHFLEFPTEASRVLG